MQAALELQQALQQKIGNIVQNYTKAAGNQPTKRLAETYLARLDEYFLRFERNHDRALSLIGEDADGQHPYFKTGFSEAVEADYLAKKGVLREIINQFELNETRLPASNSRINSTQLNASYGDSAVKLPRLELTKFCGRLEEWENFKSVFVSAVHGADLSNILKFQYLRMNVRGDALDEKK